ncbi:MAG TPA: glycine cleavage system protein H [Anaeromyxobacter sp.]|nr:glycine cleavage system protein H [Anaeromyxobacter sp.]
MTYDLLSVYPAKLLEYGLAIGYLLLFIPFWRYLEGGRPAPARAPRRAAAAVGQAGHRGWFRLPAGLHVHPGHTWARLDGDGLVTVGLDDFASKLLGPLAVKVPAVGVPVAQGEAALEASDGRRSVRLAAPVEGTVVEVNDGAGAAHADPYGAGWLFRVRAPRLGSNLRQLLSGSAALRLLEDASEELARRMNPELGVVLQDGGAPVSGIARTLAGDGWDTLARGFFLT